MAVKIQTPRQRVVTRTVHTPRQVVVPDRTMRQTKAVSPIINMQPVLINDFTITRHQPISSTKVHAIKQVVAHKKTPRPTVRQIEVPISDAMNSLIKRHNDLPKHLARTAGRAHLLEQALKKESQKSGWHRRILAGITNG
jgi:hypothetical protein